MFPIAFRFYGASYDRVGAGRRGSRGLDAVPTMDAATGKTAAATVRFHWEYGALWWCVYSPVSGFEEVSDRAREQREGDVGAEHAGDAEARAQH